MSTARSNQVAAADADVMVRIDFDRTLVVPPCEEVLAPALTLSLAMAEINAGGQVEVRRDNKPLFEVDDGALTTSPGLGDRVVAGLRAAGRSPAVPSRRWTRLLKRLDFSAYHGRLDGTIVGCEQAANEKRRPMDLDWVRDIRDQSRRHAVPLFFKPRDEGAKLVYDGLLDGEMCQAWPNSPGANKSPFEAIANDRPRVLGGGREDSIDATDVAGTMHEQLKSVRRKEVTMKKVTQDEEGDAKEAQQAESNLPAKEKSQKAKASSRVKSLRERIEELPWDSDERKQLELEESIKLYRKEQRLRKKLEASVEGWEWSTPVPETDQTDPQSVQESDQTDPESVNPSEQDQS